MPRIFRYQVGQQESKLQVIDGARHRARYISRDVRRSVVDMALRHCNLRVAARANKISEQIAFDILLSHFEEQQEAAVRLAMIIRGPEPPAPAAGFLRRAA